MCFCGARALCALGEKVLQSSCTVNMLGNPLADPFVDVCVYIVCVSAGACTSLCVYSRSRRANLRTGGARDRRRSRWARTHNMMF